MQSSLLDDHSTDHSPHITTPTSSNSSPPNVTPSRNPSVAPRHALAQSHRLAEIDRSRSKTSAPPNASHNSLVDPDQFLDDGDDGDFAAWDADNDEMASDRPAFDRPTNGKSSTPLLAKEDRGRPSYESPAGSSRPPYHSRRSTFRSRSPDYQAAIATRKRYTYAAIFLVFSLISFVIQTETSVYIQHTLKWNKAYCMLWLTHGSWSLLWPVTLIILRIQKRKVPWDTFWKRHTYLLRTTAQMVESQQVHLSPKAAQRPPIPYILRTVAYVTTFLTVAGASWYVAVDLTTPSDLTAIYNCSAFFAYAFSIPLLGDKFRWGKAGSVLIAIVGVIVVAYGDAGGAKHGTKSGGGVSGNAPEDDSEGKSRALGNIVIGVGSVLYGLYEVLYKKKACPPEGTSAGRGMIFAMTFGSLIGCFTLFVLWIPLPILHFTGIETFEFPTGEVAYMLAISTLTNAIFSGCFLVLISLTSPVLSSVAALLTIFLVAIVDWLLGGDAPSAAAIVGGILIIGAFLMLSWSTYKEMDEERRKKATEDDEAETEDEEADL